MKQTNVMGLIVVLLALLCSMPSWAGATYYKNLSLTIHNPETAKGRVYLTPGNASDTAFCVISKNPRFAKVEGNFSNNGNAFQVKMFVLPADGYVLKRLITPSAYTRGEYTAESVISLQDHRLPTLTLTLDEDTANNCTKQRPSKGSPLNIQPENIGEYYAVFEPAKKATVRNQRAGALSSTVRASRYGESVNDLVVSGPINKQDLQYLNRLSQEKDLTRLDLSNASFTIVPDSVFYQSNLYELKLPSNIEAVGSYAFAYSKGLKPVQLPNNTIKGQNIIAGCSLMELFGIKEQSTSDGTGSFLFDLLLGY